VNILLPLSHDDLIALIPVQYAQIEGQASQIIVLTARIAELEAKLAGPRKTPDNSSIPPSKGQKSNLSDRPKKPHGGRPGVARALAEHPERIIEVPAARSALALRSQKILRPARRSGRSLSAHHPPPCHPGDRFSASRPADEGAIAKASSRIR
jgi:hypothetical protein